MERRETKLTRKQQRKEEKKSEWKIFTHIHTFIYIPTELVGMRSFWLPGKSPAAVGRDPVSARAPCPTPQLLPPRYGSLEIRGGLSIMVDPNPTSYPTQEEQLGLVIGMETLNAEKPPVPTAR